MNAYDQPGPGVQRFLQAMQASFRIGHWLGAEVRMFWIAAVLMPLLMWSWLPGGVFLERLLLTVLMFVGLYGTVLSHEFGHALWARRYHIATPLITLSPLGGLAHLGASVQTPRQELLVALAGPAVHLLWLVIVWPLAQWLPWGTAGIEGWRYDPLAFTLSYLVELNQGLLLFNLLPFFPMDGGRGLRALLAMRMHANRATLIATAVGIGGAVWFLAWGLLSPGFYGSIYVFLGIANLTACLQERVAARHHLIYGEGTALREPWQGDPEAWKRGADPFARPGSGDRPPGLLVRLRLRRDPAVQQQRRQAERAQLDAELDQVLDRVRQVGLTGLSNHERAVLDRASRARRGAG